ncbi:MAG: MarR family transcriptional regulator [Flavobacteriales bacterium]|nr:MAG: MarR family transcriptional regulator [Flavobacteriales bacterium]
MNIMSENSKKNPEIDLMLKSTWLAVSKMYGELAKVYDSTAVQALTLLKIDPINGTKSTSLGPKMAVEPTSLTRVIKILENQGYIYKEKSSKTDKREVRIKLTESGLKHREISKEVVVGFNNLIAKKVSKEKLKIFEEVMEVINDSVQEMRTNNKI